MTFSRRWVAVLACLLIAASSIGGFAPSADAANANEFSPGRIISDATFHDTSSMSSTQIQSFLQTRVPSCTSGYTCLRDYRQTTWTRAADAQCATYEGRPNELASEIISRVAAACGVNPQVLLVLLEKEQSLVSSKAPSESRYAKATGYACPDTAACDAQFAGFYNQVYKAAWQFRVYENRKTSFNWFPVGAVSNILYHPNSACGRQAVFIENQATANLYYYTPYTPNAAALSNLYGTGDGCSSYGNRNFWRIFADWFGSPAGPKTTFGAFDSATAVVGGIQITGWSLDPYTSAPSYIWVDVDGTGQPYLADDFLNWVEGAYPTTGPNHGFDEVIAASPGTHRVCVSGINAVSLGCRSVTVRSTGNAAGVIESVTASYSTIEVTGWSLDRRTSAWTYVWINIDGRGGPAVAAQPNARAAEAYPALGADHGFSASFSAPIGRHEVCVWGTDGVQLGCRIVWVPDGARGAYDSVTAVSGGVEVSGWSLDLATTDSTYIWVNVDGRGGPFLANQPLNWIDGYFPGAGPNHGFRAFLPTSVGDHEVCVYGTRTLLGCKRVTVASRGAGSFDTATAVPGGIRVTGWAIERGATTTLYPWVNIDGSGGPVIANVPLNWIDGYSPGVGPNHGFDATFSAAPGTHQVCIFGLDSQPLGCKAVVVR